MSNGSSIEKAPSNETELLNRRLFLRIVGTWSGAAILAAVGAGAWLTSSPNARAAGWINRRGPVRGGGWINGGGGGGWVNRRVGGWRLDQSLVGWFSRKRIIAKLTTSSIFRGLLESCDVRQHARSVGVSWGVDETYLKIRGQWVYLNRAVDKAGRTVDFLTCPAGHRSVISSHPEIKPSSGNGCSAAAAY